VPFVEGVGFRDISEVLFVVVLFLEYDGDSDVCLDAVGIEL
jgi:hypothetical protein